MKKIIIAATVLALFTACGPQKDATTTDPENLKEQPAKTVAEVEMMNDEEKPVSSVVDGHLRGVHDMMAFTQAPYKSWFNPRFDSYNPDPAIVEDLTTVMEGVEIRAYMGTWCGDSKRETPKFYKLLNLINYDQDDLTLVAVDRSKTKPEKLVEDYNINRVPTFIFYKGDKELGRFVEYPRETLEKDILKIVSGQDYKHSYEN
jgi:thiol-disulfide isomerase/thioredoxin